MKTSYLSMLIGAALCGVLTTNAHSQKFKADVPKSILTPDSVETRIGTLKFTDGLPDKATVVLFPRSLLTGVHFDRT